jgi:hypothetical protein
MIVPVTPQVEYFLGRCAIALAAAYLSGTPEDYRAVDSLVSKLPPALELRVTLMAEQLLKGGQDVSRDCDYAGG